MKKKYVSISTLDVCAILLVCLFFAYLGYRLTTSFNYKWNWAIITDYLFFFDEKTEGWHCGILLQGLFITIKLSFWGMLLAAAVGLCVGIISTWKRLFFKLTTRTYVELIRNTPALVLVFIFYYFVSDQVMPLFQLDELPYLLSPGMQKIFSLFLAEPNMLTQFLSGVITLGLFQGAYIAEIVRAGIISIHQGQWEASAALGLTRFQQMRYVILPQAIKTTLPPLANEFINTIKYSSIVSIISIQELTFQGMQVMASTQVTIEVWLTITGMYLILCFILSLCVNALEKKLATGR